MLTPTVTYLGPAHPQHGATFPAVPTSQHTGAVVEMGATTLQSSSRAEPS